MTLIVPFDGSDLAEAALVRATEFGKVFDEDVMAVSVIPKDDRNYAREKGWIDGNEAFDMESIVSRLHQQVTDVCPTAGFQYKIVDRFAPSGTIANRLRQVARNEDASMVFIGSKNAGHLVTAVSSVGGTVAADDAYDVVIVRHRSPTKIARLKNASPREKRKSDMYLPE